MYDVYSSAFESFLGLGAMFLIFLFVFLVSAVCYVISSIANARVLKYFHHPRPWGGWVPIYCLVCLSECMKEEDGKVDAFLGKMGKKYFVFWPVAIVAANAFIPYFGTYLGAFLLAFFSAAVYKDLLSQEAGRDDIALGIISGIFPIVWIIVAFIRFKGQRPIDIVEEQFEV